MERNKIKLVTRKENSYQILMAVFDNEVNAQRPCPISGSHKALVVCERDRHKKPLRNVINMESGLIYVDPVPFKNTEEFYKNEYRKSYKGVHEPKPKHIYRAGKNAIERLDKIKHILHPSSKILDAGSSSGEFVYLAKRQGHRAFGLEANIPYAEFSRKSLKIEVTNAAFSQYKGGNDFDCITLFHVLEHLEYPLRDLTHLSQCLKPGGFIVIEVPNISYHNMTLSHKWHPGHLYSYTNDTLVALLETMGFTSVECTEVDKGANVFGIFEKTDNEIFTKIIAKNSASSILANLLKANRAYYWNLFNYLKPLSKLLKNIKEMHASSGKSPKMILDRLLDNFESL